MRHRQITVFLLVAGLFIGVPGSAKPQSVDEDISAIHLAYSDWVKATNAKDISAWSSFLSSDPFFAPPDHPALKNREQVIEFYSDLFADPNFVMLDCEQRDVTVARSRDMAWSRGICMATFIDEQGVVVKSPSKWTKVWVREESGEWKCNLNTWNEND